MRQIKLAGVCQFSSAISVSYRIVSFQPSLRTLLAVVTYAQLCMAIFSFQLHGQSLWSSQFRCRRTVHMEYYQYCFAAATFYPHSAVN